jgi:hypothetical protein
MHVRRFQPAEMDGNPVGYADVQAIRICYFKRKTAVIRGIELQNALMREGL